jgi:large subunit ribosomal protein L10
MNREEKAAVIDEVAGQISSAEAIFAVDYRGITVAQVKDLRVKLQDADTKLRVVKNSLSERAADQAGVSELKSLLVGPTALAFVQGDAALAAKALSDTNRALRILDFKGGLMNGAVLSAEDVQSIARLPSRDVLNAQLVGTIAAPLSGLVRTLNALISGLAVQLGQIAEQGLVSAAPTLEVAPQPPEGGSASEGAAARAPSDPEAAPEAGEAPADSADAPEVAESPTENEAVTETETEGASDDAPSDES